MTDELRILSPPPVEGAGCTALRVKKKEYKASKELLFLSSPQLGRGKIER